MLPIPLCFGSSESRATSLAGDSHNRHKWNDRRGLQARETAQYLALLLHHFATPPEDLNSKCQALYKHRLYPKDFTMQTSAWFVS